MTSTATWTAWMQAVNLLEPILGRDLPTPWRAAALNNLGLALRARFEVGGRPANLARSLEAQLWAANLTGEADPESANRLNNLGNARWAVYLADGVLAEVDLAIETYKEAALAAGSAHQRGACLLGVGTTRWARWSRLRRPDDLSRA